MRPVVIFAIFAAGCGNVLTITGRDPDAAAGDASGSDRDSARRDAAGGDGNDATRNTDGGETGGDASDGEAVEDAGDGEASSAACEDLAMMAQSTFDSLIATQQTCATDTDCTILTNPARCLRRCTYVLNNAAVPTATDAAAQVCVEFNSHGCTPQSFPCPLPPPVVCDGGTCMHVPF